jgi:hypothetical protein
MMKIFLVDEKNVLKQNNEFEIPLGVEIISSITDIKNPKGLASITDEFSAREYFGTSQERPVKFIGERFDQFEFGITLPKFEYVTSDEFSRVRDFFTKTFNIVEQYNTNHPQQINGLVYQVDQLVLRQDDFIKYFDAFVEAYKAKFVNKSQ